MPSEYICLRPTCELLTGLPGRRLLGVTYRCLKGEATAEQVASEPLFYFGGEVELRFDGAEPVLLSWTEAGAEDAFYCLGVRRESFFLPETLVPFDAAFATPWKGKVGEELRGCSVLGEDGIPFAVEFRFAGGAVLVATGTQNVAVGDGDDLLVLTRDQASRLRRFDASETLWKYGKR